MRVFDLDVFHLCILTAIASASADENTADAGGLTELQVPRKLETQKRHLVEEEFTLIVQKGELECMSIETKADGPDFAQFEYEVVKGGYELNIDCWIEPDEEIDPDEPPRYRKIFNSRKHPSGRFNLPWNGNSYRLCFSNHFSSTSKAVYFSVETTHEALPKEDQSSEELFAGASENLDYSIRLLKYIAATTQQDGGVIAAAGGRIQFWSSCFTIVLIVTAGLQTYAIKSNFVNFDRRGSSA